MLGPTTQGAFGGSSSDFSSAADYEDYSSVAEPVSKARPSVGGKAQQAKARARPPLASLGGGLGPRLTAPPVAVASRLTGLSKRGSISSIVRSALDSDTDDELGSSLDASGGGGGGDRRRAGALDDSDEFD